MAAVQRDVVLDKTRMAIVILAASVAAGLILAVELGRGIDLRRDYRLGWMGSDGANYSKYQYKEFTGMEKRMIYINEPCNITLRYSVGVLRGRLILKLVSPEGDIVWVRSFGNSTEGEDRIPIDAPGWYTLIIIGRHTEGYFDISWRAG